MKFNESRSESCYYLTTFLDFDKIMLISTCYKWVIFVDILKLFLHTINRIVRKMSYDE